MFDLDRAVVQGKAKKESVVGQSTYVSISWSKPGGCCGCDGLSCAAACRSC